MDVHIMSLSEAVGHKPVKPTYTIRIYSSFSHFNLELQKSPYYKRIVEYTFDDNDAFYQTGPVSISPGLAYILVKDFAENKNWIESLLVHCSRGKNRSPAVTIALNDIFGLGCNSEELKDKFKEFNPAVYKAILEAGQEYLSNPFLNRN